MSAGVPAPLAQRHRVHGGEPLPLGDAVAVAQYAAGLDAEVTAVREAAGVLDLSHLGAVEVTGPDRNAFVNRVACNDVSLIAPGQLQFSALLTDRGTFMDEITVLRFDERLVLITNAENATRAWTHLVEQKRGANIRLRDIGAETGHLGIEGPRAEAVLQPLADRALGGLPFRGITRARIAGCDVFCARHGYSGEDGFELLCRERDLDALWTALVNAGAAPVGMAARDRLRLEMGYVAWGFELNDTVQPAEAGLARIAPLGKGAPFVGLPALREAAEHGPLRRLAGVRPVEPAARLVPGDEVFARDRSVGRLCSAAVSRYAGGTIATAFLTPGLHAPGTPLVVVRDGAEVPAVTAARPFIGPRSRRA